MNLLKKILILITLSQLFACGSNNSKVLDTPTSGEINIIADESYAPLLDAELASFQSAYKNAKINIKYLPEEYAIRAFLQDSSRLIFITRELNKDELKYFSTRQITTRTLHIATDGVTFITNPSNPDSLLSLNQIKDIMSGKITKWSEINKQNSNNSIVITFDQDNGSNLRYAKENLNLNLENKNLFVSGSNKNVIDYVAKHKDAIGIIGMNWVSDRDDTTMLSFLKKIKVVGVSKYDNPNDESEYFQPYQAYVAQNFYPLTRKLYVISREPRNGLGTGFAAYLAGDKGQRIVLKSGLYPATAPIRLINFKR